MKRLAVLLCLLLTAYVSGHILDLAFTAGMQEDDRHPHDRPGAADKYFYEQRAFPNGEVPADWYAQAKDHMRGMDMSMSKSASDWTWVSIGPTNIGGRIRAMAMDPTNPLVLYAGAAGGGVWKTTDGGVTWRPLSDFVPNLRIGSIAVHPTNPSIVFAGNGEGFVIWQDALAYGKGILRSTDAGATWAEIPGTLTSAFEFVFGIAFDPFNPDIVIASTRAGVQRSTDGGETWTSKSFSGKRGMMTVFSKTTEGLVYAAVESKGVYRSTDHGATWTGPLMTGISIPNGFTRVQIDAAPSNGDIVYAAFTDTQESSAGLYRSSDQGANWKKLATPMSEVTGDDYMRDQGSYNSVLTVSPSNPDLVWAGGIDLYRSTSGGTTWKQVTNWYGVSGYQYVHADQHAFVINPSNPFVAYAACDGGVYKTTNAGSTFTDANTGLITAQFHSGTPHPTLDVVLGGTIDNGNLRVSSGTSWLDVTGGDGGWTAIDYKTPKNMYSEIYYLEFYKSTSNGVVGSFRLKMSGIPQSTDGGTTDRCGFMAPFQMDPSDPTLLYAGTYKLYRTTNSAEAWTSFSGDLTGGDGYITAIGLTKATKNVVYTGASNGAVFVTTDGGTNWGRITSGLPSRFVTDIAVDATDPAHAWLTVSGFGSGHVYHTTNYGALWTNVSGTDPASLPNAPVNTIVIHPLESGHLIVGSDVGVFESTDGGASWMIRNDGMGNVTVADLQFRPDGTLYAATHGRGMFKSSMSVTGVQSAPAAHAFSIGQVWPNPVSASVVSSVSFTLAQQADVTLRIHDLSGRVVAVRNAGTRAAGDNVISFDANGLIPGVYFAELAQNGVNSGAVKFVVMR